MQHTTMVVDAKHRNQQHFDTSTSQFRRVFIDNGGSVNECVEES